MKRIVLPIIILALALSGIFGGISLFSTHAASVEHALGVNYRYLHNPQMLAADTSNIYVVNKNETGTTDADSYEIIVINKTDPGASPATPIPLNFKPLHISAAGGYIFLFEKNQVRPRNVTNLSAVITPIALNFTNCTAFHAAMSGSYFRIYYAQGADYRYDDYLYNTVSGFYPRSGAPSPTDNLDSGLVINSIADDDGVMYLAAGTNSDTIKIYRDKSIINDKNFPDLRALTFAKAPSTANNRLVFVSSDLHIMNTNSPYTAYNLPRNLADQTSTKSSHTPVWATALSNNEVYVIDGFKKSVDRYRILDNTLDFVEVMAAHKGGDSGYHYYPNAICVIDENRYMVSDEAGVKLVDMSKIKGSQITPVTSTTTVTKMVYDLWQAVYLYYTDIGVQKVSRYDLQSRTIAEISAASVPPGLEAENQKDALGKPFNPTDPANPYYDATLAALTASQWSLDRLNGKLYWIGKNCAIYSKTVDSYWTPKDKHHYNWQSGKLLAADVAENLYRETTNPTTAYKYPNAISPISQIPQGTKLQVLKYNAELYTTTGQAAHPNSFDFAYVLYGSTGVYVAQSNLKETTFFTCDLKTALDFHPDNNPEEIRGETTVYIGYSARVLVNNLPIYKYPTGNPVLQIGQIRRNFGLSGNDKNPGLKLNRYITVEDTHISSPGHTYYEILIDENGVPPSDGIINPAKHIYVGYVKKNFVLDSYKGADRKKFSPNARVILPNDKNNQLQVYHEANDKTPYDGEFLAHKQRIRVSGKIDRKQTYTLIWYEGFQDELPGYIETKYIVTDGISAWQIAAVIALIAALCVVGYIGIRYFRTHKKAGDT